MAELGHRGVLPSPRYHPPGRANRHGSLAALLLDAGDNVGTVCGVLGLHAKAGITMAPSCNEKSWGFEAVFHPFNQCRRFEAINDAMIERR
jgi:hypothetical protein